MPVRAVLSVVLAGSYSGAAEIGQSHHWNHLRGIGSPLNEDNNDEVRSTLDAERHNPDDGTLWKLTADHGKRCPSLYSQKIQVETYAIAKANFLLKGETMRTTWRGLEYLTISDRPILVTTAGRKSGEREKDDISIAARPN